MAHMEIILVEDVANLGNMGELVRVRPGYGRNYLIPKGYAVLATRGNKRELEHNLRAMEEKKTRLRAGALEAASGLEGLSVTITRQVGADDKLFGSVNNRDIEQALADAGHTVDRRRIMLREPLRALGVYEVPVKLHADVTAKIRVWVAAA